MVGESTEGVSAIFVKEPKIKTYSKRIVATISRRKQQATGITQFGVD